MKQLLIGLLVLQSLSSFAGIIENRKTGESFEIDLLENAEVIAINSDGEYKEIPLRRFYPSGYEPGIIRSIAPETTTNITNYDGVCSTESFGTMTNRRRLGRLGEIIFFTPVSLVLDLATLPRRLSQEIIPEAKLKADAKLIKKAALKNKAFKVSKKRFFRLKKYLRIN